MKENGIFIIQVTNEDFEVVVFESEMELLNKPYFCRSYDSAIETAKQIRSNGQAPNFPIYKQMLGEEAIKVLG